MKNFFVSYKNPITVVLAIILAGGLFTYSKLKTSLFPEITFPKVKIIADAGLQLHDLDQSLTILQQQTLDHNEAGRVVQQKALGSDVI